ncbi:hypothetical protein [Nocardia mangyaensis]|nr:hypothetical protein [Nocardia mangyaensis]
MFTADRGFDSDEIDRLVSTDAVYPTEILLAARTADRDRWVPLRQVGIVT